MRILLLTHAFNSLAQRLFVELRERGHAVSVEFDVNDSVTVEAVELFRPNLIVAPFLKRAIPERIWRRHVCLVVHPGIVGDRGPSALDWAIQERVGEWGVTVLQADAEMDAGDVWDSAVFPMREAAKSSLYRNEVTEAATACVLRAVERHAGGGFRPHPLDYADPAVTGRPRPPMRQADRAIDWRRDDTAAVLARLRAADGFPGVLDEIGGRPLYLFDAHPEPVLRGVPGAIVARRGGAVCRATADGAVWIGHLRPKGGEADFKLPAAAVLGDFLRGAPEPPSACGYREVWYEEADGAGYLHFAFYNGAMATAQCEALRRALAEARARPTRVLVLMGGPDFWSNGLHLNVIEAAPSPADESWRNINAMNDLVRDIVAVEDKYVVAALSGNAGAGGVFLALAADRVVARSGVVLNPHYKGMGNLYGSEYWTYLLPRRAGADNARLVTEARLPMGTAEARRLGLIDDHWGTDVAAFRAGVADLARGLAADPSLPRLIEEKRRCRAADEAAKPLAAYREAELARMKLNFYGFDPSYHVARYNFVCKVPKSRTPPAIALHRRGVGSGLPAPVPTEAAP
jgi:putative two-component system hydrogenase maturation factor HypX/HoxX